MRFTVVLSGLFAALAAAASESGSPTSAAPASSVSLDPAQQSQYNCLHACKVGDVNCQAHCIAVPSPDQSQVNATTACVAKCPQGDGSPSQTNTYKLCVNKCISDHYFVTSEGTPSQTGAAGDHAASNTGTDTAAAPTGSSGSDSGSSSGNSSGTGTRSGSATRTGAAATSSTTNAAPAIIASGGALAGVIAALLAL
ncbi:HFBs protein [Trichoderma guizhouense]|uniref:HFBs protein n=1 Tax=Trichoderma guizhouense TaxID=1491466 RepID=A0A1T3CM41_9HYPO|nr:HFBs protein [Trichoderma guizhouense]